MIFRKSLATKTILTQPEVYHRVGVALRFLPGTSPGQTHYTF